MQHNRQLAMSNCNPVRGREANIIPIQFRNVQPVPGLPILSVQTLKEEEAEK